MEPILSVRDLTIRFGGVVALDAFSMDVPEGCIFGLIGPNGAGKTTCFNCISGLYRPTHGSVRFGQAELTRLPRHGVAELPVGIQHRVEIARALVTRPKLLLLDEPAAGLTAGEVDELRDVLLRLHEELKLTMVVVEHNMRFVMKTCSDLAVLSFGRKLAQGSPEEVANNDAVLDAYLGGVL
jgi:ABC-type branched-subunit amino acid transport system ATPase component